MSRAFGNKEVKDLVISEPEAHTYQIKASDDLLILSSDGIYKNFSKEEVAEMVFYLRRQGHDLSKIAEIIVDESQKGTTPCKDNITLLIVSLSEYY